MSTTPPHPTHPGEIGTILISLVQMYVPPDRVDAVLHVASRLLQSSLTTSPTMQTAESLSHAMLFRLVRDRRHAESTQLAELTAGLRFEPALHPDAVWPVLYILNDLRGTADDVHKHTAPTPHPEKAEPADDVDDAGSSPPSTEIVAPRQPNVVDHDVAYALPPVNSNPFHPAVEPNMVDPLPPGRVDLGTESDDDDAFFFMPRRRNPHRGTSTVESRQRRVDDVPHAAHPPPTQGPSPTRSPRSAAAPTPLQNRSLEKRLARDLLLVVQGENGDLLSFKDGGDGEDGESGAVRIAMPAGTTVTTPVHDVVMCTAEVGFLFRIIQQRVSDPAASPGGLVTQNMCSAVVREMDSYYRSLVTLRNIDRPSVHDDDSTVGLSLRKIYVWAANEKPRLRWLARLCEETRPFDGGKILAHLRAHRGSYLPPDIHEMKSRILASACAPINRMLQRWLAEGVLADPHGEFFIMEDPKVAAATRVTMYSAASVLEDVGVLGGLAGGPNSASVASQRIWWGLFKIRREQMPGRMDEAVAQKALMAGKSIAFLRRCCGDAGWVDREHSPLVAGYLSGGKKLFECDEREDEDAVRGLVEAAKESASRRLKHLFFERFDLSHHFGAIKKYLLLSQGDFSQALMDGLAPILDGDANILRNNLTGIVDAALQSCSSFNEATDQDILERLDVQIAAQSKDTNVGWDVFSLTYRVEDAPLNTVFSPKVMDAYLLIFRLLWRLKRMDHLMGKAYLNLCAFEDGHKQAKSGDDEWRKVMKVVRRAHFVRMKMTQLVQNMQHYCTVEVLEGSWTILERELNTAADLDGMIQAHATYLTRIKDRTLLSDRSRYVAQELDKVLRVIPKFDRAQQELSGWLKRGRWGRAVVEAGDVECMLERMEGIEQEFNQSWEPFLGALKRHCKMVDGCVYLLFRLDFNGHYARRRHERGEAEAWGGVSPAVMGAAAQQQMGGRW